MFNGEVLCVIPARLESTRLSRKLLRKIQGKTLLQLVYERVREARSIDRMMVACDHEELKNCVESFGGQAVLTAKHHQSGTERIAEVANRMTCDVVVNVQGDEPLMHPETIDLTVNILKRDSHCVMSTACIKKNDPEGYEDPNVVKMTKDKEGWALYFSRSPIPFDREKRSTEYLKHLGIYAYRRSFLLEFSSLSSSTLEQREKLEQLRVLENGFRIRVGETPHDSIGVDTESDLERVQEKLTLASQEELPHA